MLAAVSSRFAACCSVRAESPCVSSDSSCVVRLIDEVPFLMSMTTAARLIETCWRLRSSRPGSSIRSVVVR